MLGCSSVNLRSASRRLSSGYGFKLRGPRGQERGFLGRSSAGAIAAYFVYAFLLPTLALVLANSQDWFRDLQPWVDLDHAQAALIEGTVAAQQWAHLAVTGTI